MTNYEGPTSITIPGFFIRLSIHWVKMKNKIRPTSFAHMSCVKFIKELNLLDMKDKEYNIFLWGSEYIAIDLFMRI